ncbi:hypothetical protein Pfo_026996 [Paulownia fortunei]|nr:hypothetical protein Pfo_026996 [Paulownia fortunei]
MFEANDWVREESNFLYCKLLRSVQTHYLDDNRVWNNLLASIIVDLRGCHNNEDDKTNNKEDDTDDENDETDDENEVPANDEAGADDDPSSGVEDRSKVDDAD